MTKKILALLLLAIVGLLCFVSVPKVQSADSIQDKASVFVTEVLGVDLQKYDNVKVRTANFSSDPNANWHKTIIFSLIQGTNKVDIFCDFKDSHLVSSHVRYSNGTLLTTNPVNDCLDYSREFLDRYSQFSQSSVLSSSFSSIEDLKTKNVTSENLRLSIANTLETDEYIKIDWMSMVNGIENQYNTASLRFRNNMLEWFSDNLDRYAVGSSLTKFSKEQAVEIISQKATTLSYQFGNQTISNLTVADKPQFIVTRLSMQPKNDSKLYPLWEIRLPLDKVYPGETTELVGALWADTGEVISLKATGTLGIIPTQEGAVSTPDIGFSTSDIALLTTALIALVSVSLFLIRCLRKK